MGRVLNNEQGVLIDIEGEGESIQRFLADLENNPPPLARIELIECQDHLFIDQIRAGTG